MVLNTLICLKKAKEPCYLDQSVGSLCKPFPGLHLNQTLHRIGRAMWACAPKQVQLGLAKCCKGKDAGLSGPYQGRDLIISLLGSQADDHYDDTIDP